MRAPLSVVIVKDGYIVAEHGETRKVDMTFSVTKTFLSTTIGLAWDRGLIADVHDLASEYDPTQEFLRASEHNDSITWDHLLRQTSDWEGALCGISPTGPTVPSASRLRITATEPKYEPGTHYKYNDVRVNLLALLATHVWRRPLPVRAARQRDESDRCDEHLAVARLREFMGDDRWAERAIRERRGPLGWRDVHQRSRPRPLRVSLFASTVSGTGKRIVSEEWIEMARTPGVNQGYGFMNWFLNEPYVPTGPTGDEEGERRQALPSAPESSVRFVGAGSNIVYVDWENDVVIVVRWIRGGLDDFVGKVLSSIEEPAPTDSGALRQS